jgi:uncharacterized repeat protein (TIGR01451 family)
MIMPYPELVRFKKCILSLTDTFLTPFRGSATPNPVVVNGAVTYSFIISNAGPGEAFSVTFSNTLPPTVSFLSAWAAQGNWTNNGNRITGNLYSTSPNAAVAATLSAKVTGAGQAQRLRQQRSFPARGSGLPHCDLLGSSLHQLEFLGNHKHEHRRS